MTINTLKTTNVKNSAYERSTTTVVVSPLFSGSRGNCTLIRCGDVNILLDAGYSYKAIVRELSLRGLNVGDIDAIVITHEHSDHVGALPYFGKASQTLIYAPSLIVGCVRDRAPFCEVREIAGSFDIKGVTVDVYECSHDARACCGYRFSYGGTSFACVTDTGCASDALIEFLSPCAAIMLESNHDVNMLMQGAYPPVLKRRILSDFGHLSNAQTAEVIQKLAHSRVKTIILAHLSEHNNTKELAFASAVEALAASGLTEGRDVTVYVADQYENEVTICVD